MTLWAFCQDDLVQWTSEIPGGLIPIAPAGFTVVELQSPLPPPPFDGAAYDLQAGAWVDARDATRQWADIRQQRDRLLQRSDWTALPDVPLHPSRRAQWAAYRQALRDITAQADPGAIVWPEPPS